MTIAASPFDTVFGLPVHSLVVHAVVVLLPLSAVGAICIALVPSWSKRFGILVVLGTFASFGAAVVARQSGEQLASRVGSPQPHVDLGSVLPLIALVLFVLVLVFWLYDRGVPGGRSRPTWLKVLAGLVVVVALVATGWTIRVGHTGSEAVWSPIVENTTPGSVPVG
jgi:hypothetical protein